MARTSVIATIAVLGTLVAVTVIAWLLWAGVGAVREATSAKSVRRLAADDAPTATSVPATSPDEQERSARYERMLAAKRRRAAGEPETTAQQMAEWQDELAEVQYDRAHGRVSDEQAAATLKRVQNEMASAGFGAQVAK